MSIQQWLCNPHQWRTIQRQLELRRMCQRDSVNDVLQYRLWLYYLKTGGE